MGWVTLVEVWQAYRKTKVDAFYESNCAHGLKFCRFEKDLINNLAEIHRLVNDPDHGWAQNVSCLGSWTLVPKSIQPFESATDDQHFCESDQWEDWIRTQTPANRAKANVRIVIDASVIYLVISTIWVLKVGAKFDSRLNNREVFANRLRRRFVEDDDKQEVAEGSVNWESHFLNKLYRIQYGEWRKRAISTTRRDLEQGNTVIAFALDIEGFYDNVDPAFIISRSFLERVDVQLSKDERRFTEALLQSFKIWRESLPMKRTVGLPVGLPCSGLIANLLLAPFDQQIRENLRPSFYGRYVDDIYISVNVDQKFRDAQDVLKWLCRIVPWLSISKVEKKLQVKLPYSRQSRVVFGKNKQRVFRLDGQAGLDLIKPIEEHMRRQSSEHRMLPQLPESESAMAEKALLVSRDASLSTAVLREADLVTLRRSGFAELLGICEKLEPLLSPKEWREDRNSFYGLVTRHLLTPKGFFEFSSYYPRIIGLMTACNDWEELESSIKRLANLRHLLSSTSDITDTELAALFENVARRTVLAILKSSYSLSDDELKNASKAMSGVRAVGDLIEKVFDVKWIRLYSNMLLESDWSRQPFHSYVRHGLETTGPGAPAVPSKVAKGLFLEEIKEFCEDTGGFVRYGSKTWKWLLCPTRALPLSDITNRLGWQDCVTERGSTFNRKWKRDEWRLFKLVLALRGQRLPSWSRPRAYVINKKLRGITLGVPQDRAFRIGLANYKTEDVEWKFAAKGKPVLTLARLDRLNGFINSILRHSPPPDYIVLPELSVPRRAYQEIGLWLSKKGVSLIAGLEYGQVPGKPQELFNQALVSIALPGGYGVVSFLQNKNDPAWVERVELQRTSNSSLYKLEKSKKPDLPVYIVGGLAFGCLICSDLTNLQYRARFEGQVDALFVLEWNQDVNSFESLVEATALDVHAFIVQANNRRYGDSRIRGPFKESYLRDVVQLKGGIHDYFVVGEIDPYPLRDFQSDSIPNLSSSALFKPFPVGFNISGYRRVVRPRKKPS